MSSMLTAAVEHLDDFQAELHVEERRGEERYGQVLRCRKLHAEERYDGELQGHVER